MEYGKGISPFAGLGLGTIALIKSQMAAAPTKPAAAARKSTPERAPVGSATAGAKTEVENVSRFAHLCNAKGVTQAPFAFLRAARGTKSTVSPNADELTDDEAQETAANILKAGRKRRGESSPGTDTDPGDDLEPDNADDDRPAKKTAAAIVLAGRRRRGEIA